MTAPQTLPLTSSRETPLYLDAPDGPLLAMLTRPAGPPNGQAALLCPGGWFGTATNRNRLLVRLARRLASHGYHVLRLDWHGVGESTGQIDRFRLDAPFTGDVMAGATYLLDAGFEDIALVGLCFGSRSGLAASSALVAQLRSIVLVSFPVPPGDGGRPERAGEPGTGDLLRLALQPGVLSGLADPAVRRAYRKQARIRWYGLRKRLGGALPPTADRRVMTRLSPETLRAQLEPLVDAGVPTLFLFGEKDPQYAVFARFRTGELATLLDRAHPLLQITAVAGDMTGFGSVAAQEAAISHSVAWILDHATGEAQTPAAGSV